MGKKFVASYSGGKDSCFAVYKAVKEGLVPIELITTYNENRSWFHGIQDSLLQRVSASLEIPLTLVRTSGELYHINFERALMTAKEKGAELCVFGDIDIEEHLEWCTARCRATGITPYFPLWKRERKDVVNEFLDAGFSSLITVVNTEKLSDKFLGCVLSHDIVNEIEESGADACGENGEYHSFTFDGPLFRRKLDFTVKDKIMIDSYAIIPLE